MTPRTLRERFGEGGTLLCGWISLDDPLVGEAVVRAGFEAALIDMQHGVVGLSGAFAQIAAIRRSGGYAMARVPVGEFQTAARLLDAGAQMIVAPMIESADDAAAFAGFVKYPPLGLRSWGPTRALQVGGEEAGAYRLSANRDTLAIAMIETAKALEAVDAILALPGIDGVFVGPSDLSIALSGGAVHDVDSAANLAAFDRIVEAARRAGKISGIYAATADHARRYRATGFDFVTLQSDLGYLTAGVRAVLAAAAAP